jgi:hypothetical protein
VTGTTAEVFAAELRIPQLSALRLYFQAHLYELARVVSYGGVRVADLKEKVHELEARFGAARVAEALAELTVTDEAAGVVRLSAEARKACWQLLGQPRSTPSTRDIALPPAWNSGPADDPHVGSFLMAPELFVPLAVFCLLEAGYEVGLPYAGRLCGGRPGRLRREGPPGRLGAGRRIRPLVPMWRDGGGPERPPDERTGVLIGAQVEGCGRGTRCSAHIPFFPFSESPNLPTVNQSIRLGSNIDSLQAIRQTARTADELSSTFEHLSF